MSEKQRVKGVRKKRRKKDCEKKRKRKSVIEKIKVKKEIWRKERETFKFKMSWRREIKGKV